MAIPRLPAPIPVHTMPPGTSMVAVSMVFLAVRTTNRTTTSVLSHHSGQKQLSSQDAQDSDSLASDFWPPAFTLDPLMLHHLPVHIDETTDMGQQGMRSWYLKESMMSSVRPSGFLWVGFTLVMIKLTISWRRSGHWFLQMKFSKTR